MSPEVDVPVSATTVWTGPNGTVFTQTSSESLLSMTGMISTSIAKVNAARNGTYTCKAIVHPTPESEFITDSEMMNGSATITVGKC